MADIPSMRSDASGESRKDLSGVIRSYPIFAANSREVKQDVEYGKLTKPSVESLIQHSKVTCGAKR